MTSMLERMARAFWDADEVAARYDPWNQLPKTVRDGITRRMAAALDVLREPDEAMLDAGKCGYGVGYTHDVEVAFQAMIDAAKGADRPNSAA